MSPLMPLIYATWIWNFHAKGFCTIKTANQKQMPHMILKLLDETTCFFLRHKYVSPEATGKCETKRQKSHKPFAKLRLRLDLALVLVAFTFFLGGVLKCFED